MFPESSQKEPAYSFLKKWIFQYFWVLKIVLGSKKLYFFAWDQFCGPKLDLSANSNGSRHPPQCGTSGFVFSATLPRSRRSHGHRESGTNTWVFELQFLIVYHRKVLDFCLKGIDIDPCFLFFSCFVLFCLVLSCLVFSCLFFPFLSFSFLFFSCLFLSFLVFSFVFLSFLFMSFLFFSFPFFSFPQRGLREIIPQEEFFRMVGLGW